MTPVLLPTSYDLPMIILSWVVIIAGLIGGALGGAMRRGRFAA
jgi:hypothetical protein